MCITCIYVSRFIVYYMIESGHGECTCVSHVHMEVGSLFII